MRAGFKTNRSLAIAIATVAASFALTASPAAALSKHTLSTSITGSGSNALSEPSDVAVDQSTGDIYVVDAGNFRVEKFTSSGEFIFMVGQEVDKTKSELLSSTPAERNICTAASGDVCQPAPSHERCCGPASGVLPGSLANPRYVAVDNSGGISSGDFYVVSTTPLYSTSDYITKFDPSGRLITSWAEEGQQKLSFSYSSFLKSHLPEGAQVSERPAGALVEGNGDLVFTTASFGAIFRLGQFGSFISFISTEGTSNAARIALGPDGDFLAAGPSGPQSFGNAQPSKLHMIRPDGKELGLIAGPGFSGEPTAFAADLATGQLYVADEGTVIRHYSAACEPSPSGCPIADSFGSGEVADVTGLAIDEASGTVYAADEGNDSVELFAPTPYLPEVTSGPAIEPTATGGTLTGHVDPAGAGDVAECEFEYLKQTEFEAGRTNEVQTVTITGATGGTFGLGLEGHATGGAGTGDTQAGQAIISHLVVNSGAFAPGEVILGPGVQAGTRIQFAFGQDSLFLSKPIEATGTDVALTAALPFDAASADVQSALESLTVIGRGGVKVSGPNGGPYSVEFNGPRGLADVPQLSADNSGLTPGGSTVAVETTTPGGDGWEAASEASCAPATPYGSPTDVHAQISGLESEITYRYRLAVSNGEGTELSGARTYTPHRVIGLTTEPPTQIFGEGATLEGSFLGGGEEVHHSFEWGTTTAYGKQTVVDTTSATGHQALSAAVTGLSPNTTYHYRVVAENAAAETSVGEDEEFTTPPNAPQIKSTSAAKVGSETALVHAQVNPGAGDTLYRVEYGTDTAYGRSTPFFGNPAGNGSGFVPAAVPLQGLNPATKYHYRFVAENRADTVYGADRTFTTFPNVPPEESCPNAHVRQQTSAAFLLDCRAYELVSAANANGYDVESNLIGGQTPYGGYPEADGRVLYGVHNGGIPGTDHPTNRGVDPYVAIRGKEGWSTEYVGIPSNATPSTVPFSSTLIGADAGLSTFAFGGPEICSPCFEDGSTGEPLRQPDGSLTQGMAGPEEPGPAAEPAGYVAKPLSADGTHFVFGSTAKFAPGGSSGQISIYDRDLAAHETHTISNDPVGNPLSCEENCSSNGIAELDISKDGSHVLLGQLIDEKEGAGRWRLYMNVHDASQTTEIAPGATEGVLFDGMTADGSKVFFSSSQHLTGQDPEHSGLGLYMWEAGQPLVLVSRGLDETPGAPGNTATCDPSANTIHEHWNTTGGEESCGVVAVGGGGGVASGDGTVYFLSPEKLTGPSDGVEGAPNLYVAGPSDEYAPSFVATLESSSNAPLPVAQRPIVRQYGALTKPTGVAIDESNGDTYVLDVRNTEGNAGAFVAKFDSSGDQIPNFGEGGQLTGAAAPSGKFLEFGAFSLPAGIAVDNDPSSPSFGDLYVPSISGSVVDKFSSSGAFEAEIPIPGFPTSVAVDPTNGDVFVSNLFGGVEVFGPEGAPITSIATIPAPADVAVDAGGTVYVANGSVFGEAFFGVTSPTTEAYEPSSTSPLEYSPAGEREVDSNHSYGVAVDVSNGNVFVNEKTQVSEFDSSGTPVGIPSGTGVLLNSVGLAAMEDRLYVANPGTGSPPESAKVVVFGPASRPHDPETDNPLVIDSVSSPEVRHTGDFQITPSGDFAAFPTTLPLTGYESATHSEIYRHDATGGETVCVSCPPTGADAVGDAGLASDGLSLTDSGRVFFTTHDPLVAADTDNLMDAYEWELKGSGTCSEQSPSFDTGIGACLALISAGTSSFNSGLLSADRSGRDAYFFTRDRLVPQDTNGPTLKIYDAREDGGFSYLFPATDCKASDECHGASSPAPPPIVVGSESGTPHNARRHKRCSKGKVRRHGKCIRARRHRARHKHTHHRGGGK